MITFLITPVKSKRDSLLFETPAQRLTFDVAETPVLFNSLSVNALKKIQKLNDNLSMNSDFEALKRQSICTVNSCIEPYVNSLDFEGENDFEFENDDITPANIFNETLNKVNNNIDDKKDFDSEDIQVLDNNDDKNGIVTHTRYNNEFCITMLISDQKLSQQKIEQYLIANNTNNSNLNVNRRNLNIIKSCECIPCKHRNWNNVDIRWENEYQTQQFQFNISGAIENLKTGLKQIIDVNCDKISNILCKNGILQQEIYNECQKTFYRKIMKKEKKRIAPNSNQQKCRKKGVTKRNKNKLYRNNILNNRDNKDKDKTIMLQHLATWSNCSSYEANDYEYKTGEVNAGECEYEYEYLPLISKEDNGCSYISCETLMGIMDGSLNYKNLFDYFIIIDCRYDFEYLGGHINGAINISDKLLIELLFKSNMNIKNIKSQRIAWIFHCEYSKHRGPMACKYFRKLDRQINENRYPCVSYPHTYVLQGGYKKFWNIYKNKYNTLKNNIFKPYGYVSMWNQLFDDKRFIYSQFRDKVWTQNKKKKQQPKISIRHDFI